MTKQELIENMREMVKYILPDECREDKDIVESYTHTMVMIAEEYHSEQLKLYNVVGRSEQLHKLLQYLSDEDELVGSRTHQEIIYSFNQLG